MFTKELRQEIIRDFAVRHNGNYNPALFAEEAADPEHPAHEWFEWDDTTAAREHRVWQAREFAQGLRIKFSVQEIKRGVVSVREVEMPFAISPVGDRDKGGGYFVSDPNDPSHMAELCRQAAADLGRWLRRYEAALAHAGGSIATVERQLRLLTAASPEDVEEAA